jgi:hypothetical protein
MMQHHLGKQFLEGIQGHQYCELLLAQPEYDAWQTWLGIVVDKKDREQQVNLCTEVAFRAAESLDSSMRNTGSPIFESAVDWLLLARAHLYAAILSWEGSWNESEDHYTALIQRAIEQRVGRPEESIGGVPYELMTDAHKEFRRRSNWKNVLPARSANALEAATHNLNMALEELRRAGRQDVLPIGLLTSALLRGLS